MTKTTGQWGWYLITGAALAVLVCFVAWPLAALFAKSVVQQDGSLSAAGYISFFNSLRYRGAFENTVILGFLVTGASVGIGLLLAFVVARFSFTGKRVLAVLPLATLVLPDIIVAQTWIMLLGNQGLITRAFWSMGISMPPLYGWNGLILVLTLQHYAYAYLIMLAAFRGIDGSLEEASRNLGASMGRTYLTVTLPVIRPAILIAGLVVFSLTIDNFGIPILLAGRIPVLSVVTYLEYLSELGGNPVMQSTLSVVLLSLSVIVLLIQKGIVERRSYGMETGRPPAPVPLTGATALAVVLIVTLVVLFSLAPVGMIFVASFTQAIGPVMHWGTHSFANYERIAPYLARPLKVSLMLAAVASLSGVIFAAAVSFLIVKRPSRLTLVLDMLVLLPLAVSGTVLGIALVNTYNSGPLILTGSWIIMAIAYFVRRTPFAVRAVNASLYSIRDSIEEASISLGVPPLKSFVKVVLPLMIPALASAGVLMWVTTLSEISATIVLYYGGLATLPIQIFNEIDSGRMGIASAYGMVLIGAIFLPLLGFSRLFRLEKIFKL